MSRATGRLFPIGLGVVAVAAVLAAGVAAQADVTTDQSGSVLVFPKVINANGRDTVIQIANTGNTLVHAHCFYTNARPTNPSLRPDPVRNPPIWQETDFFIWLTKQQPTSWRASTGRALNPLDPLRTAGAGLDPGSVPPVTSNFTGELMCVEIGVDGLPVSGNKLKGEATLIDLTTGDVSKYSGIAILAGPNAGATGRTLLLDNDQYNSCPNTLLLDHFTDGAEDPVIGSPNNLGACVGGDCPITTEITLIPCQRNFEDQIPGSATVHFDVFDEFELRLSADTLVQCWLNEQLSNINPVAFAASSRGTLTAYTRIQPTGSSGGLLGVAEETHTDSSGTSSRAAWNLQIEGSRFDGTSATPIVDEIVLTGEE